MFYGLIALFSIVVFSLRLTSGGKFPKPLSGAEEREHLLRARDGDIAARNVLIERNLRLVAHVMKKYYSKTRDQEDLLSIGTFGLIKAINTFDITKEIRLATYAARCIENEILMYFRSMRKQSCEVSLSSTGEDNGEGGSSVELEDVLSYDVDMFGQIELKDNICRLLSYTTTLLSEREREIIELRYGLCNKKALTQREVADILHISRSYVSRIEKKAIGKLRTAFAKE